MRRATIICLFLLVSIVPLFGQSTGTKITIINMDDPGEGFNDQTPKTPVAGNPGTTLGEQRLIAFQFAADLWAALLDSSVEIKVEARFDPLECTDTTAVLGSAGPTTVHAEFPNAPLANTWYVAALANKLAGEDLNEGEAAIQARFNSALNGSPGCAGGSSWYYGLDNNPGPKQTDLIVVVLHELAHGLGFLTTADKDDGSYLGGRPDVFTTFLFDDVLGATWTQMTAQQRSASATNTGNLVWIGQNVTSAAPSFLDPAATLRVNSPESIEGLYEIGLAGFGGDITVAGVTAAVIGAEDDANTAGPSTTDACTSITNGSEIAGRIALIDRGECQFVVKAKNAQNAGAIAVIIANNVDEGGALGLGGTDPSITIPTISVSRADGARIRGALSQGVQATIRLDPQQLAGTDLFGRVKMYAPDPLEEGSSVSHWDKTTDPDLLMEPAINDSLGHGVDLSRDLFADIGWFSNAVVESTLRDFLLIDVDRDGAVDPGDTIRLVASIQNNGDVTGQDVVFDLDLPDGVSAVKGSITGGVVTNQTGRVTVEIGSIPVGSEATITFDLKIASTLSTSTKQLSFQGAISGSNLDVSITDDPSTVESDDPTIVEISHTPLRAYKSVELIDDVDGSGSLSGGDRLRYYVAIQNHSSSTRSGVVFTDPLDDNVEIVPGSVSIAANAGNVLEGNEAGDRTILAEFSPIAASSFVTIGFDVVVAPSVSASVERISNQGAVVVGSVSVPTDDPTTQELFDPTIIRFPDPRKRTVRRP